MSNPLSVGDEVLWIRRFGKEVTPQGIARVRRVTTGVVYVDFDPPTQDPQHPRNTIREGHYTRGKLMTPEEVFAHFVCRHCGGKGCPDPVCKNIGGKYHQYPMVQVFLGLIRE